MVSRPASLDNRRYAVWYFVVLGALMAVALFAAFRLPDYRQSPINMLTLKPTEYVLMNGLTRKQINELKLGYIENFPAPDIGLFGNHQFQYFQSNAFAAHGIRNRFFNFWQGSLSMSDNLDFLRHLERIGKLPRDLILIHITSPNNDNGRYILERDTEALIDALHLSDNKTSEQQLISRIQKYWIDGRNFLKTTFDYATLLIGLFRSDTSGRIFPMEICRDAETREASLWEKLLRRLPNSIRPFMGLTVDERVFCDPGYTVFMRADGALRVEGVPRSLRSDVNPLDPKSTAISLTDVKTIAAVMSDIHGLAKRNGRKVAFIIPPVLETERQSAVDMVLSRALERVPDFPVLDHRHYRRDETLFLNYDHPSPKYFEIVVGQILQRDLLSAAQETSR